MAKYNRVVIDVILCVKTSEQQRIKKKTLCKNLMFF